MVNLNIDYKDDVIVVSDLTNFDLKETLECGQCFRWEKQESENHYVGIAYEKVLEVIQVENKLYFYNTNKSDFENIWIKYFDLERDYSVIKERLAADSVLGETIKYAPGIRVLNQEPYELVISFIVSARNSIPVIRKTLKDFAKKWGRLIEYKGKEYYTFPTKETFAALTEQDVKNEGGSFRSRYIVDTSSKILACELIKSNKLTVENQDEFLKKYDLEMIMSLDDDECHKALQNYNGIGAKVADCIMLFSMGKTSAFPVDIWIKRAMIHFYGASDMSLPKIRKFGRDRFGDISGFAQQYLFYYARENGIKL